MATNLENTYGLPEGFTLDETVSESVSERRKPKGNYGLPEGFQLDEVQEKETISEEEKPKQNIFDKGVRVVGQAALGGIQGATLPFDLAAIASKKLGQLGAPMTLRQNLLDDLNDLAVKKTSGDFDEADQKRYDEIEDLIKNPDKMEAYLDPKNVPNFDVGSLIERGASHFGVDLTPQNKVEMAARWIGFIKDPKKAAELMKKPLDASNLKEIGKALLPSKKEFARGVGAAEALQYAADAEFGPVGTMAILALADSAHILAEGAVNVGKKPKFAKKTLAKTVATLSPKEKNSLQKEIIQDFRDAGIQADAGTITGSNIIKHLQSTLDNSSLTGDALEQLKKNLTKDIASEYKKVAEELGKTLFESKSEAGEALKAGLEETRNLDLATTRALYKEAREIGGSEQIYSGNVGGKIKQLQKELEPGKLKSSEQKLVKKALDTLEEDFLTPDGSFRSTAVDALINNKIALNDLINYEAQGGAKQLLKGVVKEIDNALLRHGKDNHAFAKNWRQANKKFGEHAQTFRRKSISQALMSENPEQIFKKMNTPQGIKEIEKALSHTAEGRALFKKLAATKMEDLFGKNLINSTTDQLNYGTFSKLLEKGNNREVMKELLSPKGLNSLEKLQKLSGRIAESNQKFFNASRTSYQAADVAFYLKMMKDIGHLVYGNPWPLVKSGGIALAARQTAKLLADPEFLTLLEDVLLQESKGKTAAFRKAALKLSEKGQEILKTSGGIVREGSDQEG